MKGLKNNNGDNDHYDSYRVPSTVRGYASHVSNLTLTPQELSPFYK